MLADFKREEPMRPNRDFPILVAVQFNIDSQRVLTWPNGNVEPFAKGSGIYPRPSERKGQKCRRCEPVGSKLWLHKPRELRAHID